MVKNLLPSAGDVREMDSIPGSGRYPGEEENGNLLQYSCLENPMDSGAWQATVYESQESDMTEQLSTPEVEGLFLNSFC